jgi:integrase
MRDLLLKIQDKGVLDTLQKIKSIAVRVFKYSVGMGVIKTNPVADLPNDIFKTKAKKHYATITDPTEIGWLLNILDKHKGGWQVGKALQLAPYMMLRPGELTKLTWKEVDFEARLIRVSEQTMKMKMPHLVPMSKQVYNTFEELSQIDTNSDYVFPSSRNRSKSIATNSLLAALDALGVPKDKLVTHGFRHMASTRLNELGFRGEVIERQLSHTDRDKIRATYNHAEYLDERKEMMQFWADYLDKLKEQHNLTNS